MNNMTNRRVPGARDAADGHVFVAGASLATSMIEVLTKSGLA